MLLEFGAKGREPCIPPVPNGHGFLGIDVEVEQPRGQTHILDR